STNRSDQSLNERMRYRYIGHCFYLRHAEDSKICLPSMKSIQGIVIRTEIFRNRLPSNGSFEHAAKRQTIDDSGLNSKSDDAARVLIHNHQHPVRPQDHGFTSKEIHTPQAVFRMAQEREPGRTIAIQSVMKRKNPTNHILIHRNAEGQIDLLGNTGTSPCRIP